VRSSAVEGVFGSADSSVPSTRKRPHESGLKGLKCFFNCSIIPAGSQKDGLENVWKFWKLRNVDGAIDQFGDFVCVDCFAIGEAKLAGRKAEVTAPVPGFDYSGLDFKKIRDAWNK